MSMHILSKARRWIGTVYPQAPRPLIGTGAGLGIIAVLVPLLHLFHAENTAQTLYPSIPLLFLVPVLLASALGARWAGVLVACVAVVVWDWYFIPPLYTVTIYYPRDVLALIVFLAVALLVGQLATTARRRAGEALQRARSSDALYQLSLALIAGQDASAALTMLTQRLRETFDLEACAVILPDGSEHTWRTAAIAGEIPLDLRVEQSRTVAAIVSWVRETGQASWVGQRAGMSLRDGRLIRPHVRQARAQFRPLRVGAQSHGVLEIVYRAQAPHDPDREHLLETFANGAALALEQERLAKEEQAAELARESDRLKSALLSSVSHDLRTPLAGIKAAASSLLQKDIAWSEEERDSFLQDIDAEADRLTRLVSNLLDLSRIEAGTIQPQKEWTDVRDLVERVVARLRPQLDDHTVRQVIVDPLPLARLDAVQIEQVLGNLVENAAKYSPRGAPITVTARVTHPAPGARELRISVADQGAGIPPSEQTKIFDKFYRVASTARAVRGTGMGLAIVKGLVEAHGGRVSVESTPTVGSTFTIVLPLEPEDGFTTDGSVGPALTGRTADR